MNNIQFTFMLKCEKFVTKSTLSGSGSNIITPFITTCFLASGTVCYNIYSNFVTKTQEQNNDFATKTQEQNNDFVIQNKKLDSQIQEQNNNFAIQNKKLDIEKQKNYFFRRFF